MNSSLSRPHITIARPWATIHIFTCTSVSIAGTRLLHTSSIDTKLQNCALPSTCSDQDGKQLRSSKAYYASSVPRQIPHHLPHWLDKKGIKAKLPATIMLYGASAAATAKYLNASSAFRLCSFKLGLPSYRSCWRAFCPLHKAQVFVKTSVVDLPKGKVLSQHLSVQAWPELQRTSSADMSTKSVVMIKMSDWA